MSGNRVPVLVVIGGIHPPSYTANMLLLATADPTLGKLPVLVFPANSSLSVLSPHHLRHWLANQLSIAEGHWSTASLLIWAFSAGCVGAAGLAQHWQQHQGQVLGLFALDAWGVPLGLDLPVYRLSHDPFTHTTSTWLGTGPVNFYADPGVSHLDLWRHPRRVEGWQVMSASQGHEPPKRITAAEFLCGWSRQCLAAADG